ncbi:MAG: hypothetical protein E7370_00875 [Clostridiales bacterium]|nr:hypothetical protein [Clostridiales bacterium]
MKIFTKILTAVLSLAMLFSVVGFTACSNGELEAKIAELEAQIATQQTQILTQQEQIAELEQENEEMQADIAEQQQQIAQLEQEKQELEEEIEYLESQISENVVSGTFYSLEDAYNIGLLKVEDLNNIAYLHSNNIQNSDQLSDDISRSIRYNWAEIYNIENNANITLDDIEILKYFGTYNNCAVVMVDYKNIIITAQYIPITLTVGGVNFNFGHPRYAYRLRVFII